jgi:hypothetical protein
MRHTADAVARLAATSPDDFEDELAESCAILDTRENSMPGETLRTRRRLRAWGRD